MNRAILLFLPLLSLLVSSLDAGAQDVTRLYLVRHAEKASDGTDDPPLTRDGVHRAKQLAKLLRHEGVTRLYSTDWQRTRSTLAPMAKKLRLNILLFDSKDPDSVDAMLADCAGHTAVICGHSNSTPALVNRLLGEQRYEPLPDDEYGKLFLVVLQDNKVREVTVTDY